MLQYLHIENIAVIEQANIEFTDGFNVMTGETGAGKSIIIDSLFAIMGERTSRELIRHGCDRAVVSASFVSVGKLPLKRLSELGYSIAEDEELIIQRVLFADGRGQVKINSQPANVSTLKEIGRLLINIHGQHDNQNLLSVDKHMAFIDAFADNTEVKNRYTDCFNTFRNVTKELDAILVDEEEKLKRAELLRYQIDEIRKAEVMPGDLERLKAALNTCRQSERILSSLNETSSLLGGADDPESTCALDALRSALKSLSSLEEIFPCVRPIVEGLTTTTMELEGVISDVASLKGEVNTDPEEQQNLQARLDVMYDLMLKYGNTEEQILEYLTNAEKELDSIETDEKRKNQLEALIEPSQQALIDAGAALTDSRVEAAAEICKRISDELRFLDFNGAVFKADVEKGRYTKNGCDLTEFMISANVGEAPKPLVKIASGGELSRIMLAIRSVLSLRDDVGCLVFDEIDSGISGHAAHKVAVKLYDASRQRQVICVTHLAQIAAAADRHLFISKSVRENKTYTEVTPLDSDGRIKEIARIMSGGEYTENLLKTAEELISLVKK